MITVTKDAAAQINHSVDVSDANNLALRIAISKDQNNSFQYAMGFDEVKNATDLTCQSEGVTLVYSSEEKELLQGMTLDFVELEDGQRNFVFLNPNDPAFTPPQES